MISHLRASISGRDSPDGFIIVAVLWILGALATLVSLYAVYIVESATSFGIYDDRVRAEALVSAAIELSAYRLALPKETRQAQGSFTFRMGRAVATTEFIPENARIDVNAAPKDVLIGLFASLGASAHDAEDHADRVIAWRTAASKGDDSEAARYRDAGLRYGPRGGPFPHTNELSLVLGIPTALLERALPFLTVYSGRHQVNALAAAPQVIAAVPGMTPDRANAFLATRRVLSGNPALLNSLPERTRSHMTLESGKTSRVTVRVAVDGGRRMLSEAVILLSEEGTSPYFVLSQNDNLDDLGPANRAGAGAR